MRVTDSENGFRVRINVGLKPASAVYWPVTVSRFLNLAELLLTHLSKGSRSRVVIMVPKS